jgi:ABC-type cobalamin/Fe3+-siderophores transport system ATPase subunit
MSPPAVSDLSNQHMIIASDNATSPKKNHMAAIMTIHDINLAIRHSKVHHDEGWDDLCRR